MYTRAGIETFTEVEKIRMSLSRAELSSLVINDTLIDRKVGKSCGVMTGCVHYDVVIFRFYGF